MFGVHLLAVFGPFANLEQWSALVGFALPLLIAVIQQPFFSRTVRTIIGVVVCLATALLTAMIQGNLTWDRWANALIFIFLTAMTSYRNVWVPIGAAPWLEQKTSRRSTDGRHRSARTTHQRVTP